MQSQRMQKLQAMLEREPDDPFLLYALAMEHKKAGQLQEAIGCLDRVLAADPNHGYAYHQRGLIHESLGDLEAARQSYREGIKAAERAGDAHAREEIAAALGLIE